MKTSLTFAVLYTFGKRASSARKSQRKSCSGHVIDFDSKVWTMLLCRDVNRSIKSETIFRNNVHDANMELSQACQGQVATLDNPTARVGMENVSYKLTSHTSVRAKSR